MYFRIRGPLADSRGTNGSYVENSKSGLDLVLVQDNSLQVHRFFVCVNVVNSDRRSSKKVFVFFIFAVTKKTRFAGFHIFLQSRH